MAGFDPVGVAGRRLRKARKTTFKRIKKVKLSVAGDIRKVKSRARDRLGIQGNIMDPFNISFIVKYNKYYY